MDRALLCKGLPFWLASLFDKPIRDGRQDDRIAKPGIGLQGLEPLQVKHRGVAGKPVQRFIKQARVMPANARCGQQQGFRVDHMPGIRLAGMSSHPEAAPLPPKEIERRF